MFKSRLLHQKKDNNKKRRHPERFSRRTPPAFLSAKLHECERFVSTRALRRSFYPRIAIALSARHASKSERLGFRFGIQLDQFPCGLLLHSNRSKK